MTLNVNDRRVQRTRRLLHEAFISLIVERGYGAITIRDVVHRAGVGRSTFYAHFADLEDLLVSRVTVNWLREFAAGGTGERRPFRFTRGLLEHANGQRRLWRALAGKPGRMVVRERFRANVQELVREDVVALVAKQPPVVLDAIVHYVTGAFMELLVWWLDSRTALTPADIDKIFRQLTWPPLEVIGHLPEPIAR